MAAVVDRVACPECGVSPREPCEGPPGVIRWPSHVARKEALRALQHREEAERKPTR